MTVIFDDSSSIVSKHIFLFSIHYFDKREKTHLLIAIKMHVIPRRELRVLIYWLHITVGFG